MKKKNNNNKEELNNYMIEGMTIGMCGGMAIGVMIKKDNKKHK